MATPQLEPAATPITEAASSKIEPHANPHQGHLVETRHFRFTGRGNEFFRIWLVNLSLSILTIGLYSAWAKVRTRRYFYGHTRLASDSNVSHGFEYLAQPLTLLKSRIVAVVLLALYTFSSQVSLHASWVLLGALYIVIPWMVYRSLRFNARVTRFRNVHFNFVGTAGQAYHAYLGWPLLGLISLGILYPKVKHKQLHYRVNHSQYGNQTLQNPATVKQFLGLYAKGALIFVLAWIIAMALFSLVFGVLQSRDLLSFDALGISGWAWSPQSIVIGLAGGIAGFLLLLWPMTYFQARRYQLQFNGTQVGLHRLSSHVTTWGLYLTSARYWLLMPITLGLIWPWYRVAVAKYKSQRTTITLNSALDEIEDHSDTAKSAIGEELGDVFDIGI